MLTRFSTGGFTQAEMDKIIALQTRYRAGLSRKEEAYLAFVRWLLEKGVISR